MESLKGKQHLTKLTLRIAGVAVGTGLSLGTWNTTDAFAYSLTFSSTSNPSSWQVAVNMNGKDGELSSFPTTGFNPAVAITGRTTEGINWIANNSTGTNGSFIGDWKFFVFRQTFDLTGYDPTTANLSFQWAADDDGHSNSASGTWKPKYRLNSGNLIDGKWFGTWPTGSSYFFGPTVDISSGFINGVNTIDFYVQGNGVTDGFALKSLGLNVEPVPEPITILGSLTALGFGTFLKRKKTI
jgi:hypothetical protein